MDRCRSGRPSGLLTAPKMPQMMLMSQRAGAGHSATMYLIISDHAHRLSRGLVQVVAAVMHLGNIQFAPGGADDTVLADRASQQSLHIVADLLKVPVHHSC